MQKGQMKMEIPRAITDKYAELVKLCEEHPDYIPIEAASKFLNTNAECLKASIENGNCCFAIMWKQRINGYRAFKIPTLKFFLWCTNSNMGTMQFQ